MSTNPNRRLKMKNLVTRFANDESGATAIEYGLIAALIAVAIIGALSSVAGGLGGMFNSVNTKISAR
jgi:pilus assembly protein Flp/PilA